MKQMIKYAGLGSAFAALSAFPAWAQEAAADATEAVTETATEVAALVPYVYEKVVDKGDVAWQGFGIARE